MTLRFAQTSSHLTHTYIGVCVSLLIYVRYTCAYLWLGLRLSCILNMFRFAYMATICSRNTQRIQLQYNL
ncbi:hypothetical protein HMPREF3232_00868 [Fannyhessea vaginae]|nr:hypothetical protein HMPREF3232_00868 [Fannyhessea vaginae]